MAIQIDPNKKIPTSLPDESTWPHATSVTWALNTLQNLGYFIQNITPNVILQTPWSSIYRFDTDQGYCYLKQIPPGLSLEAQVIDLLKNTFDASVPQLIANNPQEHCFLMQDAGVSLRDFFKRGFKDNLLIKATHDYIAVQHKSIPHLNLLLNLGVSDWRLARIPACYSDLIQQEKLLMTDGLTSMELQQLSRLTPKLIALCERISKYGIPDTFSHNDFHDNNLLIDPQTQQITMVDLGEVAVTHPFFSLLNIFHHVKENCVLQENIYQSLQQWALQPWQNYGSQEELLVLMSLIQQCCSVHRALTVYRLLTSIEATSKKQLLGQGRLVKPLRIWLSQ